MTTIKGARIEYTIYDECADWINISSCISDITLAQQWAELEGRVAIEAARDLGLVSP
jgi:hypothetical protein